MGDPSDSSSGEEDGDVAWRAAIDSVATTTSTYVSSIINGSSDMAAKQRLTSADDGNDCRNQKLKHYQIKKAIILWTYDPCERDAKLAREALENSKKSVEHLKMIVEMSCASSPDHSVGVRQAYTSLLHCSLEEDIASNVSPSSLAKLLVAVVSSFRYDRDEVDSAIANLEASRLHEAIKIKQLDDDHVNWILSTRNF
ncbi:annexin D3-like isoform X2 [Cannabis sativa]|uniref:annexin D3-like isoform X2 n=1 Tax=Cannabis sativa TaxID=3483 RepID=UPI0029C9F414|nr:annexin D3-like isoform X2 [Cannabis sativa]